MKILFVATVRSHIGQFHIPFIKELKRHGCIVDAAFKDNSNEKPGLDLSALDNIFEVPFSRSPFGASNIKAYFALKKIIENGDYDAVHCHTPMGGVVARLASVKARKRGMKVIYTAHGFHFYKGSSFKSRLLFLNAEKILSRITDCLITINNEDLEAAVENGFKAGMIVKVNGVGVDVDKFRRLTKEEKEQARLENGYNADDFLIIYPADLCPRKNQQMIINALAIALKKHKNMKLLLPGATTQAEGAERLINELGVNENVDILGYRRDIDKLAGMCDASASSARQEGLPVNIIEAMAMGNAVVATDVRGNNDLIKNNINGFLVEYNNAEEMAQRFNELYENPDLTEKLGQAGLEEAKKYSIPNVIAQMSNIYTKLGLL